MNQPVSDPQLAAVRTPPHSIEAEQSVLGGLLLDNTAWDRIADLVGTDDFYRNDHRLIFAAISRLIDASKAADAVTVFEALRNSNKADDAGGLAYLSTLAQNTPSAANIRRYAEIVRERAVLRRLVTAGDEIATSALNPAGRDTKQILDEAESRVFRIAEEGARGRQGFIEIQPLLTKVVERIQELFERANPSDVTGVPTGFADIDSKTSGLQPGDLVIVAGRPSMGKTSFALNVGEHVAIDQGMPVAVFSMEMGASQLALRMLSSVGRLDQQRLRTGRLLDEDWPRLTTAIQKMHEAPLYIDETPALTAIDLRARARRLARTCGKLGLIIVDYLQLMSASGQGENRATEISEISRGLEGAREGTRGSGSGAVAVEPHGRTAHRQAPGDVGPARIGRDRAGRRRDSFHLPRRGLQPRHERQERRRDHHRQAAQRSDRARQPALRRSVHEVRKPGAQRAVRMTSKFVADRSEHHRPLLAALRRLVPRDRRFFPLFNRQAQLILEGLTRAYRTAGRRA